MLRSEHPPDWSISGLGDRNADDLAFLIAQVKVELGEELDCRQGIGRLDAQIAVCRPRDQASVVRRVPAQLDPPPDAQAVGEAGDVRRAQIKVALRTELAPQRIPESPPCDLGPPGPDRRKIPLGRCGLPPANEPGTFDHRLIGCTDAGSRRDRPSAGNPKRENEPLPAKLQKSSKTLLAGKPIGPPRCRRAHPHSGLFGRPHPRAHRSRYSLVPSCSSYAISCPRQAL